MFFLLAFLTSSASAAVEVKEAHWGFDGRAVPERVNVFSVLLVNTGREPFDGTIVLQKGEQMGERRGARLAQQCYIGPVMARWVQFYPYVGRQGERWILTVGSAEHIFENIQFGPPATVYLRDPDDPLSTVRGLKAFQDGLFPPTVGATDGLHAIVLDHQPDWEPARREAFLDWLRAGGVLHILRTPTGTQPAFTGEMAVLNDPRSRFRVGAGAVVRHDATSRQADRELLSAAGPLELTLETSQNYVTTRPEDAFFHMLKDMSKPQHNWGLIYLCLLAYVALVGPINYVIARVRKKGFAVPVLVFFSAVTCASLVLVVLGRRGYGERAAVHTLTYARPVGEGTYDVTQWSNVFVTGGGWYTIAHPGAHHVYSDCQDAEAVNGVVVCGGSNSFRVDIPLFSARPFLHRGKMKAPDLGVRVAEWQADGTLRKLVLETGPGFPAQPVAMRVLYGDHFYQLRRSGSGLELASPAGEAEASFLSKDRLIVMQWGWEAYGGYPHRGQPHEVFPMFERSLIARAIGGADVMQYRFTPRRISCDRVQLFVFTRNDSDFRIVGNVFGSQMGYVLYHIDLFEPEATDG